MSAPERAPAAAAQEERPGVETDKTPEGGEALRRERNEALYLRQLALLRQLLRCGAITPRQFAQSAGDLARKTGHEIPTAEP